MSAPKLTPDLEALFEAERESEPLPDGFGESLRARIGRSIGPGGPDGGDGGESGPGEGGPGDLGPASGGAGDAASALQGAAAPAAAGLGALQIGSLLGVFGLGLTLGAFGHAAYMRDEAVVVAPPVETSEPVAELVPPLGVEPPSDLPPPIAEVEEIPERVTPTPARPPTPMIRLDGRALLDQAQNALARGLAREALAALDEHRRTHRRGPLREERQALQVQALAASGQSQRAEQEAAIFLARYPNSLFRDVVERATRAER